jgi:hypothetical protein
MIAKLISFLKPDRFAWTQGEMMVMRLAVALVAFFVGIDWYQQPFTPDPQKLNGFAKLLPLSWMLNPTALIIFKVLTGIGLLIFVVGIAPVFSLLPAVFSSAALGSLRNSRGDISHSTQVLAMALIGIWVAYLILAILRKSWRGATLETHRAALVGAILMISGSYVASGIVKLKASDGRWIQEVPNMAVQMIKSNLADYYSKPTGTVSELLTQDAPKFFTQNPGLAKLIFGSGLILELGAFLLLLSPRWSLIWGVALVGMHIGISLLMDIEFWNHLYLVSGLCILPAILALFRKKPAVPASAV